MLVGVRLTFFCNCVIVRLVLLLADLMASATWLANPSLLMMFIPMVHTTGIWCHFFKKVVIVC